MKVRIVRDREGRAVCAVQLEVTALGDALVEPILEEGDQVEDVDVTRSELLDADRLLETLSRGKGRG